LQKRKFTLDIPVTEIEEALDFNAEIRQAFRMSSQHLQQNVIPSHWVREPSPGDRKTNNFWVVVEIVNEIPGDRFIERCSDDWWEYTLGMQ